MSKGEPSRLTTIKVHPRNGNNGSPTTTEYLTCVEWRDIRPVRGARHFDRFCGARVVGDSLKDVGVFDGDLAIFRLTFEPHEITAGRPVACITPLGRLLRFYHRLADGRVALRAASADCSDLVFDADAIHVDGLLVRTERDW